MNNSRTIPTTQTGKSADPTPSVTGSRLTVSRSLLQFDRTDPGDESYLTLRVTPPFANALVALAVSDPNLFQVAVGVSRLAFKQSLTFKPEEGGSYVHVRYTPERSGRHQSTLTIEVPALSETITVQLAGHTGGLAAISLPERTRSLPAPLAPASYSPGTSARPDGALVKGLLAGGLVLGLAIAGYVYRCDIWPASCTQTVSAVEPATPEPTREPLPEAVAPAPVSSPAVETRRPAPERVVETRPKATKTTVIEKPRSTVATAPRTQPAAAPKQTVAAAPVREQSVVKNAERTQPVSVVQETPKPTVVAAKPAAKPRTQPAATPAQKPAARPQNNEESELEQVLNKGNN